MKLIRQMGDLTGGGEEDAFADQGGEMEMPGELGGEEQQEPELAPIGGVPAEQGPTESYRLMRTEVKKPLIRKVSKQEIKESEYKSFATFFKSI